MKWLCQAWDCRAGGNSTAESLKIQFFAVIIDFVLAEDLVAVVFKMHTNIQRGGNAESQVHNNFQFQSFTLKEQS